MYAYRLNGGGTKASNTFASAKYSGVRGNDITIVIATNIDDDTKSDVKTYVDTVLVDSQTVATSGKTTALADNDWVDWVDNVALENTAGTKLTGGTNGSVTNASHQTFLEKIESYSFNALGVVTTTAAVNALYVAFCKRLRDDMGVKFQAVVYNTAADYEGCVNVKNAVTDAGESNASLVYWVTGVIAGTAVNKSVTNKVYDGEFTVNTDYTQSQLETALQSGEFVLHKVGSDVRVLEDINSLVTTSDTKGEAFKDNQTIRVIDQVANDFAVVFNTKYLGTVPNDAAGRISLWSDFVAIFTQLQDIRAIQDFTDEDVTVEEGATRKAVVANSAITPVGTMTKLYMQCEIR